MKMEYKIGIVEAVLAFAVLVGSGTMTWSGLVAEQARMDERIMSAEKSTESFTKSVDKLADVMQEMSISFGRMDERLGGVERSLKEIRSKI